MLWHIVRFRFPPDVDEQERRALEAELERLRDVIAEIEWVAVARSIDEPDVTGLLTLFEDAEALAVYRDHPEHTPVVARARAMCNEITGLDVEAGIPLHGPTGNGAEGADSP